MSGSIFIKKYRFFLPRKCSCWYPSFPVWESSYKFHWPLAPQSTINSNNEQDRFTTVLMICGTGSLFWRVGRRCKILLVPRIWRQANKQNRWRQMHKAGTKVCKTDWQTGRQIDRQKSNKTGSALRLLRCWILVNLLTDRFW